VVAGYSPRGVAQISAVRKGSGGFGGDRDCFFMSKSQGSSQARCATVSGLGVLQERNDKNEGQKEMKR